MDNKSWQPSNEPDRYDEARVATLKPVQQAIRRLRLPPVRLRKLMAICNAVEMQIEDGGDTPLVNDQLLESLRLMVVHQVGRKRAAAVHRAIDGFARTEAARWEQVRAGTLPPPEVAPDEELNELMQDGYTLISANQTTLGCDIWLVAWEKIKQLANPTMRRVQEFDNVYSGLLQSIYNWSLNLEVELLNAARHETAYLHHRIRFVREYLAQFPDDDAERHVAFRRAEGASLWRIGKRAEAEAVYRALVAAHPDHAWAYIGWSDEYYLWRDTLRDYEQAEAILRQALARPKLDGRHWVEQRLARLYEKRAEAKRAAKSTGKQTTRSKRSSMFRSGRRRRKK